MRLNDALATVLRDLGVRYVFGVSGANIEHLHDSLHRLGDGRLTAVLTKREDGAAFMADARARIHRTLGVCCSTSGGGMMNLVAGLAESYAESVPVLAIVGQPPAALDGRGSFQDSSGIGRTVDAHALLSTVSKTVQRLLDPGRFWEQLTEALTAALSGRPGPAVLLVPRDSFDADVGPRPADWPADLSGFTQPATPDRGDVATLFRRLRQARRPVLLFGHGIRRSARPGAPARFARQARIPVATTMGARGEFPHDDPLYAGTAGVSGNPATAAYLATEADLVVAVGTGLSKMTSGAFPAWDPAKVIAVNTDPQDLTRADTASLTVTGDAGLVFEQLTDHLADEPFTAPDAGPLRLDRFVPRLAEPLPDDAAPRAHLTGGTLRQSEAIAILERYLPANGHLLYDAGNCAAAAMHLSAVPPGTTSTIALGAGGMGYSIAAAIGAQLGEPAGTRSVVFCGDGAFLMSGLEIHTAVEWGLPILYVVFNNGMHGMCATRQQTFFESRITAVGYTPVDACSVARGIGAPDRLWTGRAETPGELAQALDDYQKTSHLPGVLDLRLAAEEVPPFLPLLPPGEPTAAIPAPSDT